MHILITDSGVGGLSVCAYLEHYLRTQGTTEPVRLTFVNAAPSNEAGYNAMASRQQKVDYFDRFLQRVADKYSPDLIYVACNTLSVLLADTGFAKASTIPVRGIVEAGGHRLLQGHGIGAERIISQACPNLADVISEDRQGALALERIEHFVQAALGQSDGRAKACLVYMGCTHYGYR